MTLHLNFHHIGRPVPLAQIQDNPATKYSPLYDMYSLDQQNSLGVPIELHAFGPDSSLDARIRTQPHVAFTTDDLDSALVDAEIILPKYTPFQGYSCAMILLNNEPVELIETSLSDSEIWGDGIFKDSILYPDGPQPT